MTLAAKLGELAPIARSLFRNGLSWRSSLGQSDWRRTFKPAHLFTLLDKPDDVDNLLKHRIEKLAGGSPPCIIMRPGKGADDMLPIIQFRYEKEQDFEKVSFRVAFMQRTDQPQMPYGIFGFRYESPERGSTHDFYHVQPIRGFDKNDSIQDYSCSWMPTRFPTFPIVSRDPFELFVVMLYSVQGERAFQSFTSASENARVAALVKRFRFG
jgi:hypothetical protein